MKNKKIILPIDLYYKITNKVSLYKNDKIFKLLFFYNSDKLFINTFFFLGIFILFYFLIKSFSFYIIIGFGLIITLFLIIISILKIIYFDFNLIRNFKYLLENAIFIDDFDKYQSEKRLSKNNVKIEKLIHSFFYNSNNFSFIDKVKLIRAISKERKDIKYLIKRMFHFSFIFSFIGIFIFSIFRFYISTENNNCVIEYVKEMKNNNDLFFKKGYNYILSDEKYFHLSSYKLNEKEFNTKQIGYAQGCIMNTNDIVFDYFNTTYCLSSYALLKMGQKSIFENDKTKEKEMNQLDEKIQKSIFFVKKIIFPNFYSEK